MRGTRLELRSEALRHNARVARQLSGDAAVYAMVKANGYGHGLVFVARSLVKDVDGFGVALLDEARTLREAGISAPIMLLEGVFDADELVAAAALGCELIVHSEWQVELLESASLSVPVGVWLKLNTGMYRLGVPLTELDKLVLRLQQCHSASFVGMASHFACADMSDDLMSASQLDQVRDAAARHAVPFSAANSAAIFRYPHSAGVRVRPGIMLYGSSPFTDRSAKSLGLQVTQRLSARIIALNSVPAGEAVGYGSSWQAQRDSTVAVVAIGYGDGYPRHAPSGTPLAVKNSDSIWRAATLAGRVSMDMITIDVTDLPLTRVGDEVELWGDHVSVDEVAQRCGTISYELFCRLTERPERVFF
ncbi:MAG: alanine racemase [Alcanivoracaceae bacterium]|jgi:alanine racemase|nr:alanine racemase [Alcanivoracaceae bacterium]